MSGNGSAMKNGEMDLSATLPIIVGAHPRAELEHRDLAYRLGQTIDQMQGQIVANGGAALRPLICCDLWYLNDKQLLERPAIAIGEPSLNAATAFLSNRLPTAFVVEGSCRLHLDPEFIDLQACLWGIDRQATEAAVELFVTRYLAEFAVEAAAIRQ